MNNPTFQFTSHATGGDQFTVVSFAATESLSCMYRYDITLKAPISAAIDLDEMLDSPACFTIDSGDGESPVHGVLSIFDEVRMSGDYIFYQATLVPRVWKLSTYKTNEIYTTEITVNEIIRSVLNSADLIEGVDYDLNGINGTLLERGYVCQFRESDFDFISRLMENEGIYYFFEQGADTEMLVIADDSHYDPVKNSTAIFDTAPQAHRVGESVQSWLCRKQRLPENVTVRDYNPEQPSLDVYNTHGIDSAGQGTEYLYGENFLTEGEAEHLAQIRAEEFACRKTRYYGESGICGFNPGYTFSLTNHPNTKYSNVDYLIIEVTHEGQYLDQISSDNAETKPIYNNTFVAIEAITPFRPPIITAKPRFFGTMTAFVYAEATSEMAEIDEFGRYRVHLPFDKADGTKESDDPSRKASCWMRMAQPYVGEGEGMYFPLRGGTEVLLTFINGDPDRPVISGALPNASTPSLLTSAKSTEATIQSKGNNRIRFEDTPGNERLILESPTSNSYIRLGAPNDPITLRGSANLRIEKGSTYTDPGAYAIVVGTTTSTDPFTGITSSEETYTKTDLTPTSNTVDENSLGNYTVTYEHTGTDNVAYTAIREVTVYNPNDASLRKDAVKGIRLKTGGEYWEEVLNRQARYIGQMPAVDTLSTSDEDYHPNELGDLLDNFGKSYNPIGLRNYKTQEPLADANGVSDSITEIMAEADINISSLDQVITREGNIYDFGGYWNYNLGNCYIENFIAQDSTAELNADTHTADLINTGGPHWTELTWPCVGRHDDGTYIDTNLLDVVDTHAADTNNDGKVSGAENYEAMANMSTPDTTTAQAEWANGKLWVEKKIGKSYDYNNGDTVSVNVGSTLSVQRGGRHVEVGYRGDGSKKSWSWSESGVSKEKKWTKAGTLIFQSETESTNSFFRTDEKNYDRNTGALYSHSLSEGTGMGLAKFDFDYSNTVSLSINTGTVLSSETYLGAKITNGNYIGGLISVDTFVGGKINIELSAGGLIKVENSDATTNIPGLVGKFGLVDVEAKATELKNVAISVESRLTELNQNLTKLDNSAVKLDTVYTIHLMS